MIKQNAGRDLSFINEFKTDISEYYDRLLVPHSRAPVIVASEKAVVLKAMGFSLIPHWLKDVKPKFATHNARIETVLEKPTWRESFKRRHCLVPISEFFEPIYEGEHAGFMVAFFAQHNSLMLAAGIWEERILLETGEVQETFAILTSEPPAFIGGVGHDRCPIFLNGESALEWIGVEQEPSVTSGEDWKNFLLLKSAEINFGVRHQRAMRPGWEKRK